MKFCPRSRPGLRPLTVLLLVVALAATACTRSDKRSGEKAPGPGPEVEQPSGGQANSADRLIFWLGCRQVVDMTDAQLDEWKRRGVDGFACVVQHLRGMGGTQDFTGDSAADLNTASYDLQRRFRDSQLVERAKRRGMDMYLGFYLVNRTNAKTPLAEWFDDDAWSDVVLPRFREVASAAKLFGFAGVAFDHELYPQEGNARTASWNWDYPGNTRAEPEVRAAVKRRGQELMSALLQGFPGVEILAYGLNLPETWEEIVQQEINKIKDRYAKSVQVDLWDGLTSVEGYNAIRILNATFYKTPHVAGSTWDTALQYEYNALFAMLSRRLSNWSHASSRVFESPFSWIGSGPTAFERARPPDEVAEQLDAFKRWGMGRTAPSYVFRNLDQFDYEPYVPAMQKASTPAVVATEPPQLVVTTPPGGVATQTAGSTASFAGYATDRYAIHFVRWEDDRGHSGVAQLRWNKGTGSYAKGWAWKMEWAVDGIPLHAGINRITITAQSTKGLSAAKTLEVIGP